MHDMIYHLRCTRCHSAYLSVPGDLLGVCFACDEVSWQLIEVFLRPRTPWVDAPGHVLRLFPVQAPADFLARLSHSMAYAREDPSSGTRYVAPGLSRIRTLHHTLQCQWDAGLCDGECPEEVTYAPMAVTAN